MAVLVGYVRVSGDAQEHNNSLPIQREAIKQYCQKHGHMLFNIFEDVESGSTIVERQSFQNALDVIFANLADALIVYRLDRFSRTFLDAEYLKEKLKSRGKGLISIQDTVDIHSPDGELFFQMKTAFAELERKSIKDRCSSGRQKKKLNGGYYGGQPPFGWIARGGCLIEFEPEQKVIRRINALRDEGYTLAIIAAFLNEEGFTTKRNRPWRHPQVQTVLKGIPRVVVESRNYKSNSAADQREAS